MKDEKEPDVDGAVCQVCEHRQLLTSDEYKYWGTNETITHCGKPMYIHVLNFAVIE